MRGMCENERAREFQHALRESLGFRGPDYVIYEMFDIVDSNMNGHVTLAEICDWVRGLANASSAKAVACRSVQRSTASCCPCLARSGASQ